MPLTVTRIAKSYTISPTDDVVIIDAVAPGVIVTLPLAASCPGKLVWLVPYGNPSADPSSSTEATLVATKPDTLWNVDASGTTPASPTGEILGKGQPFISDGAAAWIGVA